VIQRFGGSINLNEGLDENGSADPAADASLLLARWAAASVQQLVPDAGATSARPRGRATAPTTVAPPIACQAQWDGYDQFFRRVFFVRAGMCYHVAHEGDRGSRTAPAGERIPPACREWRNARGDGPWPAGSPAGASSFEQPPTAPGDARPNNTRRWRPARTRSPVAARQPRRGTEHVATARP
jgi:hypothetical protein